MMLFLDEKKMDDHAGDDDEEIAVVRELVPLTVNKKKDDDHHDNDGSSADLEEEAVVVTRRLSSTTLEETRSRSQHWAAAAAAAEQEERGKCWKLLFGVAGIYSAFLYYGSLQEDVFRYEAADGSGEKFTQAWFLQVLEAVANVIVGYVGLELSGGTPNLPLRLFAYSGISQVSSKACNSLALAYGLSFPVATLAKSAKMAPVMAGSLILGGERYGLADYSQVALIIFGTTLVSAGSKKSQEEQDSLLGVIYILLSLILGGVTGGFQKRLQRDTADNPPKPYDFMFWTNLFMCATAFIIAFVLGELTSGTAYCMRNPEILSKILQFSACSAVGQSFIFYTLAHFDPLITATVTTSRKLFSVLISVLFKGNSVSWIGWTGLCMAGVGILLEPLRKFVERQRRR